jgi:hypothetical protein
VWRERRDLDIMIDPAAALPKDRRGEQAVLGSVPRAAAEVQHLHLATAEEYRNSDVVPKLLVDQSDDEATGNVSQRLGAVTEGELEAGPLDSPAR